MLSPNRIERVLERWMKRRGLVSASDESGMSLVEILVAVFILAVAVIAIASTAAASLQSVRESRERQDATQFASTVLEEIRALPFSEVALDDSTIDTTVVPDFEGEDILALPGGEIPHVQVNGNQTATTYITIIPKPVGEEELRAIVLVTWGDVDGPHTVRQETRIAEATRGLPVPSFNVSPASVEGTGVTGETICMDQTLTNLGEQDSYSWQLFATNSSSGALEAADYQTRTVNEPDGSGGTQSVMREGFKVKSTSNGAHWFGWARMAIPASSTVFQEMEDTTGDQRPDSPGSVLALGDATIRFCYTAVNAAGDLEATSTDPVFTPRIYSAFDESVNTGSDLSHTLHVTLTNTRVLYLHEPETALANPKTMSLASPQFTDEALDYDADGVPGLEIADGFDPTRWTANTGTLGFSSYPRDLANPFVAFYVRTDDDSGKELVFDVSLLLNPANTSDLIVLSTVEERVAAVTTAWQSVEVDLPLSSTVSVGDDDTLYVEIGCATSAPCHVHYDVTTLGSLFRADFQ